MNQQLPNASPNSQLDEWVEQLDPILRHINPHRFLWGFTVVCAFVAWNRGLLLLYGLVALLLAVLLVSYVFYWINVKGLQLTAKFLENDISVNEPCSIQVGLSSQWRKHFLQIHFPIQRVSSHFSQPLSANVFVISHKHTEFYHYQTQLSRGVYQLSHAEIMSAYPFGLLQSKLTINLAKPQPNIYVLPTWFVIPNLPITFASALDNFYQPNSSKNGHDDFDEIRPYRRGDALKTIHWGASARQVSRGQDWLVKTFNHQDFPSAVIVLNPFDVVQAHFLAQQVLDNMISTALAFGQNICQQGFTVTLVGFDNQGLAWSLPITPHWFLTETPPQPHEMYPLSVTVRDSLRLLAEVDVIDNPTFNYPSALQTALQKHPASLLISFGVENSSLSLSSPIGHIHINFCQSPTKANQQENKQLFAIPFSTTFTNLPNCFL